MVQYFPPPDTRSLLPPLLACLPTSSVSPKPPPALLPLLTPILRQRVQLLAATASSPTDSWLPLLCWEAEPAKRLVDLISDSSAFELHPVSGEIDFGEVKEIKYRRLDEETLHARVELPDLQVVIIYLWCENDQEGGANGWRVSEVRPLDDEVGDDTEWSTSIAQADESEREKMLDDALRQAEDNSAQETASTVPKIEEPQDDDDDYWAQYDKTPGPGAKSAQPASASNQQADSTSEADYFARYAEVQPEMDNEASGEDRQTFTESTLDGNVIASSQQRPNEVDSSHGRDNVALPNGFGTTAPDSILDQARAPSPRSHATTVTKLEECVESQSMTETAIKHHVSTSIKSLYRLCRSSGITSTEFERMIHNELDTLSMMEDD